VIETTIAGGGISRAAADHGECVDRTVVGERAALCGEEHCAPGDSRRFYACMPRTQRRLAWQSEAVRGVSPTVESHVRRCRHMPVKNMMCAFGVPGYMIHGTPGAGFSVIPVDFSVAPGMYTTYSHFAPVTLPVAVSKLFGGPVSV